MAQAAMPKEPEPEPCVEMPEPDPELEPHVEEPRPDPELVAWVAFGYVPDSDSSGEEEDWHDEDWFQMPGLSPDVRRYLDEQRYLDREITI
jgi:hypothetical protein